MKTTMTVELENGSKLTEGETYLVELHEDMPPVVSKFKRLRKNLLAFEDFELSEDQIVSAVQINPGEVTDRGIMHLIVDALYVVTYMEEGSAKSMLAKFIAKNKEENQFWFQNLKTMKYQKLENKMIVGFERARSARSES